MLPNQAPITQLIHLLDAGQTAHPALVRHHLQSVEVQMTQTSVPPPCLLCSVHQHANRLGNGGVEHVEPVRHAQNLRDHLRLCVSNCQHTIFDSSFIPDFVELSDAEDVGLELGDEIYAGEDSVFSALAAEDDGPAPFDAHH
jgi:hypothetical protein